MSRLVNYKGLADQGLLRKYTENTQACPRKNRLQGCTQGFRDQEIQGFGADQLLL